MIRRFKDRRAVVSHVQNLLFTMKPLEQNKRTASAMQKDRRLFPIRKVGSALDVVKWIRGTIDADHLFARKELSRRASVSFELCPYHGSKSGLEITTRVQTGYKGSGHILWLQLVVRMTETRYAWWSHN